MPGSQVTEGDCYNIECPWCGKINHYVTDGEKVPLHVIRIFEKECFHCKKPIIYEAIWALKITASQKGADDRLNFIFGRINRKNKAST